MIKSVIFDFGNVIAGFDNQIFIQYLVGYTDKSPKELTRLIYEGSGLPKKYETGLITSQEFFEQIKKLANAGISKETFSKIYTQDKFWPIPSTIEIIRDLKKNNYKVGLLSNTSEWDYELGFKPIFRRAGIEFDSESLSFKVGAMKPDEKIYRNSLNILNIFPEQCVYIDDIEKYVDVARKLGMSGVHYNYEKDDLATKLVAEGINFSK